MHRVRRAQLIDAIYPSPHIKFPRPPVLNGLARLRVDPVRNYNENLITIELSFGNFLLKLSAVSLLQAHACLHDSLEEPVQLFIFAGAIDLPVAEDLEKV